MCIYIYMYIHRSTTKKNILRQHIVKTDLIHDVSGIDPCLGR